MPLTMPVMFDFEEKASVVDPQIVPFAKDPVKLLEAPVSLVSDTRCPRTVPGAG